MAAFAGLLLLSLFGAVACGPKPRSHFLALRPAEMSVAVMPLANYSNEAEAPERIAPIIVAELGRQNGVELIDPGKVEAVLATEPWLLRDRIPPDLVDRFGHELGADAILVGSVLACGHRDSGPDRVPHCSISLRLLKTPGAQVLWTAVHSRDGADGEWLFGFGRVNSLEQLTTTLVQDIFTTFPRRGPEEPVLGNARQRR